MSPEDAIRPFITTKPHSIGSGLGLHIADELMKSMHGKLLILSSDDISFTQYVKDNEITKAIVALCFPKSKKVRNDGRIN